VERGAEEQVDLDATSDFEGSSGKNKRGYQQI
jgi:hypothetical protein